MNENTFVRSPPMSLSPVSPMRRRGSGNATSSASPRSVGDGPPPSSPLRSRVGTAASDASGGGGDVGGGRRSRAATVLENAVAVFRRLRPDYYLRREGPTHWFKVRCGAKRGRALR